MTVRNVNTMLPDAVGTWGQAYNQQTHSQPFSDATEVASIPVSPTAGYKIQQSLLNPGADAVPHQVYLDPSDTRIGVAIGTSSPLYLNNMDATVTCRPGASGTMKAQLTWSVVEDVQAGAAVWTDWDLGTTAVGVAASRYVTGATAVRFVATTAAGIGEVTV